MRGFFAVTDDNWFRFLRSRPDLDEVNFWQPSAGDDFKAVQPGEPLLFKLHAPDNCIAGGGFYTHFSRLPVSLAWEAFEERNGVTSLEEMRQRIEKYRRIEPDPNEDYTIGCIILRNPFFFDERDWIAVPDWKTPIVRGKGYDLSEGTGAQIWERVRAILTSKKLDENMATGAVGSDGQQPCFGTPFITSARLGQGTFRVVILDAFDRRCAVTGERTLPVLQAAHIRPYKQGGSHRVDNGLLLREDLHTLLDRGYVTVTPEYRFRVSRKIREDYSNGRDYYALDGKQIVLPSVPDFRPRQDVLAWHEKEVFRS
jgi:putative restriction endonuclease